MVAAEQRMSEGVVGRFVWLTTAAAVGVGTGELNSGGCDPRRQAIERSESVACVLGLIVAGAAVVVVVTVVLTCGPKKRHHQQ